jgi:uncharacterized membrane protein
MSQAFKRFLESEVKALVGGILLLGPVYLAILMMLKAMKSLGGLVRPLARLLPKWFPAEAVVSLFLVLMICFLVGIALRTASGQAVRARIENSLLERIPGYEMFRSLTRQLAGQNQEAAWKPALVEIEEALVPGFVVEELDDGRFTVFVPSVPTPLAGSIYILSPERVHPLDVPFTQAVKVITRWGSGSKDLVAAMQVERAPVKQKRDDPDYK